jgi:hypothetical protein
MKHTEFRITFTKDIVEYSGRDITPVHYSKGHTITVDEVTFDELLKGSFISRNTREGYIQFNKYDVENEVQTVSVTVEYGKRKLGQRKNR